MFLQLERLFRHLAWAEREIIAVLDPSDSRCDAAIKLFVHIVAAEHIWLSRIHSRDIGKFTPWTEMSLPECEKLSATTIDGYLDLIGSVADRKLSKFIDYRTTRGDPMRSPLGDILLQVALHGSYHRGQIASKLRSQDLTVPATDFIVFSRQFPIEEDS